MSEVMQRAIVGCLILFVTVGAACAEAGPAPDLAATAEEAAAIAALDLSSPQAAVRTFYEAMSAVVDAGNDERVSEAIACLYIDKSVPEDERFDAGTKAAHELYEVLSSLKFKMADIAEEVAGADYVAKLGEGEHAIELKLHRYDDGKWRFSSRTTQEASLEELREAVEEEGEQDAEAAGVVFDEWMKSPRVTMQTFLRGMNETDGLTIDNAIATLDLAHIDPSVRREKGRDYAIQLKSVIDRYKRVEYAELPPESERPPFVFLRDPKGNIVLDAVVADEETGSRAWKFTRETLDTIEDLYLKYKDRGVAEGLEDRELEVSYSIRLRDWMYDNAPFLLRRPFYLQNWQWLGLFTVILFGMAVSRVLAYVLIRAVRRLLRMDRFTPDSKLERDFVRPIRIALMAWFWLIGLTILGLPPEVLVYLRIAAQFVTAAGAVWAAYRLIDLVGEYLTERAVRSENRFDDLLVPIVTRSAKVFVVVIAIVLLAKWAGRDPATVLTGLGLGGLAFALAAKDVVANVFGSFTILLDRPFQIGDWVVIGDIEGSVESVGVRSTRIRTFYNSLITVPNSELINTSVDNMGARRYRRIKTMLSVAYDTPPEKLEAFCEGIRELIRQHPYTRKDYYHCYFNEFAADSLGILVYCFVETPEWATELREKHRLFSDILRLAQRLGVEFAFPTQTLYVRQDETPAHGESRAPDEAIAQGRKEANTILREFLGPRGTVPPPVVIETPEDALRLGESGAEDEGKDGAD